MKAYLLRLHRWIALVFALPLLGVILSGAILSIEPLAQRARPAAPLSEASVLAALTKFDGQSRATGLTIRTYDQVMTIAGAGPNGAIDVSLRSGDEIDENGWAEWFGTARQLHERLLLDLGWLVTTSTIAMLVIVVLGVFMGWPRLRNSLGGWHSTSAWILLPLLVLSPLTGLAIAFGVSFAAPVTGPRPERVAIRDAVSIIAKDHALADLTSLRVRGGRQIARIYVGSRLSNFIVTRKGLQIPPMNWPRALHEGNWHAFIGSAANLALSVVLLGLWGTGLIIWGGRYFRKRRRPARARLAAAE